MPLDNKLYRVDLSLHGWVPMTSDDPDMVGFFVAETPEEARRKMIAYKIETFRDFNKILTVYGTPSGQPPTGSLKVREINRITVKLKPSIGTEQSEAIPELTSKTDMENYKLYFKINLDNSEPQTIDVIPMSIDVIVASLT